MTKLLLLLFLMTPICDAWPWSGPYCQVHEGCHDFYGYVKCANGKPPLRDGKLELWELDDIGTNDKVAETAVIGGMFHLHSCTNDGVGATTELYMHFLNNCNENENKYCGYFNADGWTNITLVDDKNSCESNVAKC